MNKRIKGFTLVELLVVLSILSVLVTVTLVQFRNSQARGRDAQRKNDLKQISNSLELYYSDYHKYPDATTGQVSSCPYNPVNGTGTACSWGTSEFSDGKTTYFKVIPKDPSNGFNYYYRIVDSPLNQKYQLFARLENSEDQNCLEGTCDTPPVSYSCGVKTCNFAVTSSNTTATE